jgi:SH3-like domain-containing protein
VSAVRRARGWLGALALTGLTAGHALAVAGAPPAGTPPATGAAAAPAQSLYVVEQVVVNVNSAPDASGERIATVKSGERVELIERVRDQVRVRLNGGRDGWIRASYLSAEEPLRARLEQRDADVARLQQEVSGLMAQLRAERTPAAPAPGSGAARGAPSGAAPAGEDPAALMPATLLTPVGTEPARRLWPWALGSVLLSLCVGFVLGALVLDRHIRRKYGGLRIY